MGFKEVRLSPKIGSGDFLTKVHRAVEFLEDGDRIKVTVRFRGRELSHPELGRVLLERFSKMSKSTGSSSDSRCSRASRCSSSWPRRTSRRWWRRHIGRLARMADGSTSQRRRRLQPRRLRPRRRLRPKAAAAPAEAGSGSGRSGKRLRPKRQRQTNNQQPPHRRRPQRRQTNGAEAPQATGATSGD